MRMAMQTASYFARASGYLAGINEWGAAERRVIENASLAEFDRICADVAGAGFSAMELWMAHAFPKFMTPDLADEMKAIWQRHGLQVVSYSCSLGDPLRWPRWSSLCFETARMLGIGLITSGIGRESAPAVADLCKEYGIRVAAENHPEKHPDEILAVIGDHGEWIGACVDTGWFGVQGFPADQAIWHLKEHLLHLHLKDVATEGEHHSVRLGTGIVPIADCIQALKYAGYRGAVSIEQEAEDHDPTSDCAEARAWVQELLGGAAS